jgi:uncharacterized protein YjdB
MQTSDQWEPNAIQAISVFEIPFRLYSVNNSGKFGALLADIDDDYSFPLNGPGTVEFFVELGEDGVEAFDDFELQLHSPWWTIHIGYAIDYTNIRGNAVRLLFVIDSADDWSVEYIFCDCGDCAECNPGGGDDPNDPIALIGISLNKAATEIAVGQTEQLTVTFNPPNATNKEVAWTSSNPAVATVSATGLVTAVAAGNATITATSDDGEFTATCVVTVPAIPVTGITLSRGNFSKMVGGGASTVTATILPANATDQRVNWVVSGSAIRIDLGGGNYVASASGASVSIVAIHEGVVQLTARSVDNNAVYRTITITVSDPVDGWVTGFSLTQSGGAVGNGNLAFGTPHSRADGATFTVAANNFTFVNDVQGIEVLEWESSDTEVLAISGSAASPTITLKWIAGRETVTLTARATDGSGTERTVTFNVTKINVTSVTITGGAGARFVALEGTLQLSATANPANASLPTITWSRESGTSASISATGLITATANAGATTFRATADGQGTNVIVNVFRPLESVGIASAGDADTVAVDGTLQLTATKNPTTTAGMDIASTVWSSSNTAVAEVDEDTGEVTGVSVGTAIITLTVNARAETGEMVNFFETLEVEVVDNAFQPIVIHSGASGALLPLGVASCLWNTFTLERDDNYFTNDFTLDRALFMTYTGDDFNIALQLQAAGGASGMAFVAPDMVTGATPKIAVFTFDTIRSLMPNNFNFGDIANIHVLRSNAVGVEAASITEVKIDLIDGLTILPDAPRNPIFLASNSPPWWEADDYTNVGSSFEIDLVTDTTVQLNPTVLGTNANRTIVWTSDTTGVATVNATGLVTAVSQGTAKIRGTITTTDGRVIFVEYDITVNTVGRVVYGTTLYHNPAGGNIFMWGTGALDDLDWPFQMNHEGIVVEYGVGTQWLGGSWDWNDDANIATEALFITFNTPQCRSRFGMVSFDETTGAEQVIILPNTLYHDVGATGAVIMIILQELDTWLKSANPTGPALANGFVDEYSLVSWATGEAFINRVEVGLAQ